MPVPSNAENTPSQVGLRSWLLVGAESRIGQALSKRLGGTTHRVLSTTRTGHAGASRLVLGEPLPRLPGPEGLGTAVVLAGVTRGVECARDPAGTFDTNVVATVDLIEKLREAGWHVVFPSSDAVFAPNSGRCDGSDHRRPATEYGRQKAQTEDAVSKLGSAVSILRLSKVVSFRESLWKEWIAIMREGGTAQAYADDFLSPLRLADATSALLTVGSLAQGGTWQASGLDAHSYADMLEWIANEMNLPGRVLGVKRHVDTRSLQEATVMSTSRLEGTAVWKPPSLQELLGEVRAMQ